MIVGNDGDVVGLVKGDCGKGVGGGYWCWCGSCCWEGRGRGYNGNGKNGENVLLGLI